jgi:hypothetical protein
VATTHVPLGRQEVAGFRQRAGHRYAHWQDGSVWTPHHCHREPSTEVRGARDPRQKREGRPPEGTPFVTDLTYAYVRGNADLPA